MSYSTSTKFSTPNLPLFENSSDGAIAFADFILSTRATTSPRGDLIALYKTLINARAFPTVTCWRDLYRFMVTRSAAPTAIHEARKLWNQYKTLAQSQPAIVSPGKLRRALS